MILKRIFTTFICLILGFNLIGQQLFIPRSLQKAYTHKTRSMDGKPGVNYWQNHGDYKMELFINPPSRNIVGKEVITYYNNSPDTLKKLNIKLIQNHHKPEARRGRPVPETYLTDGIKIDYYAENGVEQEWTDSFWDGTDKWVELSKPLLPQQSINLEFHWNYDVSLQSGREGAIDSTTFFLGYFHPRVAVYDDYEGWDRMPHILTQEFYNDFNNYEFSVTLPGNYIVWATGDLMNPEEVLQKEYYEKLKKSMTSDETIRIANGEEVYAGKVTAPHETNTWKWKADYISDIAIGISNHYNWDAGSVVVDTKTGRRVSSQAAYDEESKDFQRMVEYINFSLEKFSLNKPGVPYPYSKMTGFRGFANMEFPMMFNNSSQESDLRAKLVAEHEIAHSWFPFYMGINETKFGYMDEGMTVFFEYFINVDDRGKKETEDTFKDFRIKRWVETPDLAKDLPIILPTDQIERKALSDNIYGKAALSYLALYDYLGEETFMKALHEFMDRWNGKHPTPWDFFYTFNTVLEKNLNWFWKKWFFDFGYIDYAIHEVKKADNNLEVLILNKGGLPTPIDVIVTFKDGTFQTFHQSIEIWEKGNNSITFTIENTKEVESISLDGGIWMDMDTSDNTWRP